MSKKLQVRLMAVAPTLMSAVHMAALGFVKEESEELIRDVREHLESGKLVYRIFADKVEIGFAIFVIYQDILYLSGIILTPKFQGRGIVRTVIQQVQRLHRGLSYLALRTQSLRMYLAASRMCDEFYPGLEGEIIPEQFAKRGEYIASLIHSEFPVHLNCYGGQLYGIKPIYKDPVLQDLWDKLCNFENGDAIIFIGRLR